MTTSAKFEAFCTSHRDEHGLCFFTVKKPDSNQYVDSGTRDALLGWQAALSSLEVTPELVEIACKSHYNDWPSYHQHEREEFRRDKGSTLGVVFAAIKEGKA